MKVNNTKKSIWQAVLTLDRLVFTTREIAALTSSSISSTSQSLKRLEEKKICKKVLQGVWALVYDKRFSPMMLIPFLCPSHQSYLSFISALHLHGIISQIPQIITIASTRHTKKISTPVGVFQIHQLEPTFFTGFDWHRSNNFLVATQEKALVDCLYIASRKSNRYSSFPELEFPKSFKKKDAFHWVSLIKDKRLRKSVYDKLREFYNT